MRFPLFIIFLLTLIFSGCVTKSLDTKKSYMDSFYDYKDITSDGKHLIVHHTAFQYGGNIYAKTYGKPQDRWTEIELAKLDWIPIDNLQNAHFSMLLTNHEYSGVKLQNKNPVSIPLYFEMEHSAIASIYKSSKQPIVAFVYNKDHRFILARENVQKVGEIEVSLFESLGSEKYETSLSPGTRKALYPVAILIDVVSFPLQVVYYIFTLGQIGAH